MSKNKKQKRSNEKTTDRERVEYQSALNSSQKNNCIDCFGDTNPGLVRTNNEDSFVCQNIWDDQTVLAIAIDGLGGYEGGEVASRIAKEVIVNYLEASANGDRLELLKQAVTSANNTIFETSRNDARYHQMGCVLTAIIVDVKDKEVYMAHVGDSRLYSFRHGILTKLSHDHSYVGYLEEIGDYSEEQAMHHPNRNVVDRVIGQEPHLSSDKNFIEAEVFPLEPFTTFLLCSDGLTDMITSASILNILSCDYSIKEKVDLLIKAALDAGGKDNVTTVLVEYLEDKQVEKPNGHIDEEYFVTDGKETEMGMDKKNKKRWFASVALLVFGFIIGFFVGRISNNQIEVKVNCDSNQIDSTSVSSGLIQNDSIVTVDDKDSIFTDSSNLKTTY